MLSSAAAAALSTLPRSFHHTRPHLTSRLCPNTNLIRPRERRKRPTFPFFFVFFFFFSSRIIPVSIDHVRDELTRLLATIKRSFTLQQGSYCYRLVSETMLTCARRIVRDDSATFAGSTYYRWITKKIFSSFLSSCTATLEEKKLFSLS